MSLQPQAIRLKSQQGKHPAGSVALVYEVVPHGGHSDDSHQYVLEDETHVLASNAEPFPLTLPFEPVEIPSQFGQHTGRPGGFIYGVMEHKTGAYAAVCRETNTALRCSATLNQRALLAGTKPKIILPGLG